MTTRMKQNFPDAIVLPGGMLHLVTRDARSWAYMETNLSEHCDNNDIPDAIEIAATLAACEAYGAKRTHLLEHTTSAEVGRELSLASSRDAVGYAGIVID